MPDLLSDQPPTALDDSCLLEDSLFYTLHKYTDGSNMYKEISQGFTMTGPLAEGETPPSRSLTYSDGTPVAISSEDDLTILPRCSAKTSDIKFCYRQNITTPYQCAILLPNDPAKESIIIQGASFRALQTDSKNCIQTYGNYGWLTMGRKYKGTSLGMKELG